MSWNSDICSPRPRKPTAQTFSRFTVPTTLRDLVERDEILQQIARGTWRPPSSSSAPRVTQSAGSVDQEETIHETLSRWWAGKRPDISDGTAEDYEWRLGLLLGFDPEQRTADIGASWINALRADLAARKSKNDGGTLSPRSVNMALTTMAAALDVAVDDGLLPANPARGPRRRMKASKPARSFLEPDQAVAMLDAAGAWKAKLPEHQRYGRRALLALLVLAGPRIGEAIAADRGDFDLAGGQWRIPASKTDAGRRTVELSDYLVKELRAHMAAMKKLGRPASAKAPMFPTLTGGRHNDSNIRTRLLDRVQEMANESRSDEQAQVPRVTPHSLRRTYASLALAAGDDLAFVMGQLGHADPRMTLAVYAQVQRRRRVDKDLIRSMIRVSIDPLNDPMEPKAKKSTWRRKPAGKKKPRQ
jgi:integrase